MTEQPEQQPTISDELRVALMQVWSLGFLDAVAGSEVTDDDVIPTQFGDQLKEMATRFIDEAVPTIAPPSKRTPPPAIRRCTKLGSRLLQQ